MTATAPRSLAGVLLFVGLVVAVVGSLGAPLITAVAQHYGISLAAAQWTLTVALLSGAIATPLLGRLGSGPRRRETLLATLAIVTAGSILTAVPLPFAFLLIGRAGQGIGLGLTALTMATARDHLDEHHGVRTIALLSVGSTVGIGVGYPLAGLLTDFGGIRAAYGLGALLTAAALLAATLVIPPAPPRERSRIDIRGALLLTVALVGLLLVISQTAVWRRQTLLATAVLVVSLALLAGWALRESRSDKPLVNVRLLRNRAIAAANLAMLTGGIGMYLLLGLITRYVQTPATAGYGFGLNTFQAGLVLVPFSLLGFVPGRLVPRVRHRLNVRSLLATSTAVVLVAFVVFALARTQLAGCVVAVSILGFGVGAFSAAMPAIILAATPEAETSSSIGVNQIVRSVGFSVGSALGGLILAAYTTAVYPFEAGYAAAAWTGTAIMLITLIVAFTGRTGRE